MKLYTVTTTVTQYRDCKNVRFNWFKTEPELPRPYAELIADYDPEDIDRGLAEGCIDELFTADEALALAAYLEREYGEAGTTEISEVALPIPHNTMGDGAIAVGGGDDFYMLDKVPSYSLPFKVWGYFDLCGCELVDGSGVYHERMLILDATGELRQQTNEEAARDVARPNT